tara:strand:+ start:1060 stop:1803 length:744 start_codon:yes stop_codon:yes gene_type:complete
MIKFFRKIRQNNLKEGKTVNYLKYALGEIVLVVIGILIALQINTWNDNQKKTNTEKQYLKRLKEEAKWNIQQIDTSKQLYLQTSKEINSVINNIENNSQDNSKYIVNRPNYIHPWLLKTDTYEELVSTGTLNNISDLKLRDLLNQAESYSNFSEKQLENWRNIGVSHEANFIPYRSSRLIKSADSTYYKTFMDFRKIKGDTTIIELLKYWSQGNIVFYEGVNGLKNIYTDIFNRIECLENYNECQQP